MARSFNPPREYIEWHHETPPVNCFIYNVIGKIVSSTGDNTAVERDFFRAWNTRNSQLQTDIGARKES